MKFNFLKATNIELTDAIKAYADERFTSLDKLLGDFGTGVSVDVEVGKETQHHQKGPYFFCEATMHVPGEILRAEQRAEDLYEAIDEVKGKLHRQITDLKNKLSDRSQRGGRLGKE